MNEQNQPIDAAQTADAGVQAFLDSYARALTAGDGKAVADLWAFPALLVADGEVKMVQTPDEVAQLFAAAKAQYNAQGVVDTRGEIQRLQWLTTRIVAVDARWPQLDATGATRSAEQATYTLCMRENGGFGLRVAVMRGVIERGI